MELAIICAYILVSPAITLIVILLTRLYLKWTIKMCKSKETVKGKIIIVTGSNTGIGFHVARDLAARGGRIILACRNEKRGLAAREKIITETNNTDIVYKHLNLSSLTSVRKFAEEIKQTEESLDVLVNNAGVHGFGDRVTEDGIVEGMQINYFAPFLLTLLLLPLLEKSRGRIVNVSSLCHFRGEVNLEKINEVGYYDSTKLYANSKLCIILFTVELAEHLKDTGVVVNSLHPGVILTNILSMAPILTRVLFFAWCWVCCRTPVEGAQTAIYLSVARECAGVSGKYFVDCKPTFTSCSARNLILAVELWRYSERMVSYKIERFALS